MRQKSKSTARPSFKGTFSPEAIETIREAVFTLAAPLLGDTLVLLAVDWEREAGTWYLRLYLERRAERLGLAVSLDECARLSQQLDPVLEAALATGQLPIPAACAFHLEVSSPGLFRQLKTARELAFYLGSPVKVQEKATPSAAWMGTLGTFDPDTQCVEVQPGDATDASAEAAPWRFSLPDIILTLNPQFSHTTE
jgi:ribosome maturation factor RimP